MKIYEGVEAYIYVLLSSALDGNCLLHDPVALLPRKEPSDTHWIGG
jgi:hypothetical protein